MDETSQRQLENRKDKNMNMVMVSKMKVSKKRLVLTQFGQRERCDIFTRRGQSGQEEEEEEKKIQITKTIKHENILSKNRNN